MKIADQEARLAAIDPTRSFVVQAPAGSGKTGLLTQRFLRLLAHVERPEEIVAITFTRKAAAEMRQRLLEALESGHGARPDEEFRAQTWVLAREVLERDRLLQWNLQANPGRLRIGTIDSLCSSLVAQMPVLSGLGGAAKIAEQPDELYAEAASATLAMVEEPGPWASALEHLLTHLDNDVNRLHRLLVTMLARRDQWLPSASVGAGRENLENSLRSLMLEELSKAEEQIGWENWRELVALLRYAASNLEPDSTSPIRMWLERETPARPDPEDLPYWRGAAELLLTREGQWRRSLTKTVGFPTSQKKAEKELCNAWKQRAESLLARLGDAQLAESLHEIAQFPDWRYRDDQWATLESLLLLLRVAAAQLLLVMGRTGTVDFSEIAQRALQALGTPEEPTELALSLDNRLRHLLLDEFQDTSLLQKRLLEKLVADWQPGDGRTLFLVGDPMQSIYRFRNAEVRIFLEARAGKIAQVSLESLTLSVNFRCQQGLVDWFNETFADVFPRQEDRIHGGVPYSMAHAARPRLPGPAVGLHAFESQQKPDEAETMLDLIRSARASEEQTVAVLVRSRTHLAALLPLLRQAGVDFSAVELENLAERPVVQDLLCLTRSLLHLGDRPAWFSILRAPWCGLSLADLHALREAPTVWQALQDVDALSPEGQARALSLREALQTAWQQQGRFSLRRWVENCWVSLGGPACCEDESELEDAEVFFQLLEQLDRGCDVRRLEDLQAGLQRLYAVADPKASGRLQLMTIHKSKGLEFDVVLLPGLGKRARADDPRLFLWMERPREGGSDLLLAPIRSAHEETDPTYSLLQRLEQKKARHEEARLLYVAATRARKQLHLLFELQQDARRGTWRAPEQSSLLARLWPQLEPQLAPPTLPDIGEEGEPAPEERAAPPRVAPVRLKRLPAGWKVPAAAESAVTAEEAAPFDFSAQAALHRREADGALRALLERMSTDWDWPRLEQERPALGRQLSLQSPDEREMTITRILISAKNILEDPRGRWLLSTEHRQAAWDQKLRGTLDGRLHEIRVDRTFIDSEGIRWIVHFTRPDIDEAVQAEELTIYVRLLQRLEARPWRGGLYNLESRAWHEVDFGVAAAVSAG